MTPLSTCSTVGENRGTMSVSLISIGPRMLELLNRKYLDSCENICWSAIRGWKRHTWATALGVAACTQGCNVRFFRVTGLIMQLLDAIEECVLLRPRQALGKLGSS